MNIKRILIPLLIILLLVSMVAFGSNVFLGPYFDDTYFDLSDDALILKVIPHEKGGLETDVSAYDGLVKISGGVTSAVTDNSTNWNTAYGWGDWSGALAALKYTDLADTPAAYDNGKYAKSTADGVVWDTPSGGYTNLTQFVEQTAWRVFYSNTDGDVIELPLGTAGTYLRSTGTTSAPSFNTPGGAGDMLKATYDTDSDDDIDVAAGGTEKSSWTLYCIPYLSGTTAFGEIPIGTAEYALTVNAGANGYDWTLFDLSLYYLKTEIDTQGEIETIWGDTLMNDLVDDTTPEYGGAMDHNNERDTEVCSVEFNGLYDNGNSGATPTINWQNGNYQKIAVSENTLFAFSNAFIGTITLQITYSGAYTAGFNAGYTILEEGGIEISFTETLNAVDILKVMYLGTASTYIVGLMADVKD